MNTQNSACMWLLNAGGLSMNHLFGSFFTLGKTPVCEYTCKKSRRLTIWPAKLISKPCGCGWMFLLYSSEKTGEARKLARLYHGPYCIIQLDTNTAHAYRLEGPQVHSGGLWAPENVCWGRSRCMLATTNEHKQGPAKRSKADLASPEAPTKEPPQPPLTCMILLGRAHSTNCLSLCTECTPSALSSVKKPYLRYR